MRNISYSLVMIQVLVLPYIFFASRNFAAPKFFIHNFSPLDSCQGDNFLTLLLDGLKHLTFLDI